jgi:endonuclease YncB( thermonuclease family)
VKRLLRWGCAAVLMLMAVMGCAGLVSLVAVLSLGTPQPRPLVAPGPVPTAPPALAPVRVVDGDTLVIGETRFRLFGIDAPEMSQTCTGVTGAPYACGAMAKSALELALGAGAVLCEPRDTDRYGRTVAVCRAGGQDVGAVLVSQGWALAYRQYSLDYVVAEQSAQVAKRGMWAGSFVAPWDVRKH